jgi:hypothetical protein
MGPSLRDGAIMMSFVLCVALAAAQTGGRDLDGADAWLGSESIDGMARFQGQWGSVARAVSGGRERDALPLDEEQRSRIHEGVMRSADVAAAFALVPELAETLPSGVALQDLPAAVTEDIPLVRGHKFVKLDDRILLVDPTSRIVVAMIPRYKLLQ